MQKFFSCNAFSSIKHDIYRLTHKGKQTKMHTLSNDNIYKAGTLIAAKANPELALVIRHYYQRIYYCEVVGEPDHKHLAYFERELIPPANGQ